jgi:hypothetical protein
VLSGVRGLHVLTPWPRPHVRAQYILIGVLGLLVVTSKD